MESDVRNSQNKKGEPNGPPFLRKIKYYEEDPPLVSECDIDTASFLIEVNVTVSEGEESVVFSHTDIRAGMPLGATLADEDVSGDDFFAAKLLHAKALAV